MMVEMDGYYIDTYDLFVRCHLCHREIPFGEEVTVVHAHDGDRRYCCDAHAGREYRQEHPTEFTMVNAERLAPRFVCANCFSPITAKDNAMVWRGDILHSYLCADLRVARVLQDSGRLVLKVVTEDMAKEEIDAEELRGNEEGSR